MCGIFSLLNNTIFDVDFVNNSFKKGKTRGPENSKLTKVNILCDFGFHRLAINGLNTNSNQPITVNDITLICNGEIYNYQELYSMLGIVPKSESDCEVIIHLYEKYGIEYTLQLLDGVFSFILCDSRLTNDDSRIYIARDPYGVRPLYYLKPKNNNIYGFASEIKVLIDLHKETSSHEIIHFEPGTYSIFSLPTTVSPKWSPVIENRKYHSNGYVNIYSFYKLDYYDHIFELLSSSVKKRVLNTERPIACLLSGGLDSSLITSLVHHYMKKGTVLETYSIGLQDSEDLKYAKIVADFLGTKHTEVILTEQDFLDAIPQVIYAIESYDTTTVRASIGNYLIAKYISEHSEAKVIFNGDGADELCGGYLYMNKAPNIIEYDIEVRRLLKDIHMYDVLRSDKCISSHGLEPRTPFLDKNFVNFYLSIPASIRMNLTKEKYLLRYSFSKENYNYDLLPDTILWRKKEAFSDGICDNKKNIYSIIKKHTDTLFQTNDLSTSEQKYYKYVFDNCYPSNHNYNYNIVPYLWMPRFIEAKDPSARTLNIYNQ